MSQTVPIGQTNLVLNKVLAVATDVFQVPPSTLGPASSPDTIETWDSLHHLSFVVALEQEFNVQFSPEEIEQLLSIELTTALLEEKLKGNGSSNGSGI
jgi:acyl carrier protein